jgi:hypothetical protein
VRCHHAGVVDPSHGLIQCNASRCGGPQPRPHSVQCQQVWWTPATASFSANVPGKTAGTVPHANGPRDRNAAETCRVQTKASWHKYRPLNERPGVVCAAIKVGGRMHGEGLIGMCWRVQYRANAILV